MITQSSNWSYFTKDPNNLYRMNRTEFLSLECLYHCYFAYLRLHFLHIFNLSKIISVILSNYQKLLQDVEGNPGPTFKTLKVSQGSFHQEVTQYNFRLEHLILTDLDFPATTPL